MTHHLFQLDYYDGVASLLHNHQLLSIIMAKNQLASEKRQQLHAWDLNMMIDSCTQANIGFNEMSTTMGLLLLERQELQQLGVEANLLVDEEAMLQLAGKFFTMMGGLGACVDRILNQAMDMRLSEVG